MEDIFQEALELARKGRPGALATVVSGRGSLPMSRNARMLVRPDGSIAGTVGGGCLEAEVWAAARRVMEGGRPFLHRFELTEANAAAEGLICGGTVELLIEPLAAAWPREILEEITAIRRGGGTALLATNLGGEARGETGAKLLLREDGSTRGSLGDPEIDAAVAAEAGQRKPYPDDRREILSPGGPGQAGIFLESISPDPTLYLFGGGHVSRAVAPIAKSVGFKVVVIDDRPIFANRERFPQADETLVMEMEGALSRLEITPRSYLVVVTRGHRHDRTVIRQAARLNPAYLGMIGSRRKIALIWKELEAEGIPRARLEAIHAPIGLEIGGDTPEEIAVSIMAEIIRVRRGGRPALNRRRIGRETTSSGTSR